MRDIFPKLCLETIVYICSISIKFLDCTHTVEFVF